MMEQPEPGVEQTVPVKKSNRTWLIVGAIVAVLLLVAAAFVGGRLMNGGGTLAASSGKSGEKSFISVGAGGPGGGPITKKLDIENAKELPATQPDLVGVFVRREDKTLFVGTGNVRVSFKMDKSGGPGQTSANYDGPVIEVVTTHETQVYRDVTDMKFEAVPSDGKIKQVLEPGKVDDVTSNGTIQAWGEKQGDRFVARILVYR